jgi:glutamine amidotransferase
VDKIIIVDYGMGNLNSVKRKFYRIGIIAEISANPADVLHADKIILPGVGHFQKAVENLKHLKFWDTLNIAVMENKTPILGICLGMQLMAKRSEEGNVEGFGWIDAEVIRFRIKDTLKYKVPHIGWNQVEIKKESRLFDEVDLAPGFYFVHSYHLICNDRTDVLNETLFEYPFDSGFQKDNIIGLQYHPEKSHDAGEQLLRNFIKI